MEKSLLKCALTVVALACFSGCLGEQRQVISGTVSVGGVKADTGRLFFVPVEGAKGPRIVAEITDGAYRIESGGGLLAGKYRVELDAQKRTGRKTKGRIMGGEAVERDETIPMAPRLYRDADSPLIVEIPAADDGVVNIEVPGA
jgi:hypothetical protein